MRRGVFAGVGLFVLLLAHPDSLFAQKVEINSGNGGLLPTQFADAAALKDTDIYGVRGRLLVTEHHERANRIEFEDANLERRVPPRTLALNGRIFNPAAANIFFNFKYGGGIKAEWGPVGFGFVLRGRTSPNLSRPNNKWVEATGRVTFTWGQR